jgi:hypothetical protein
MEQLYNDVVEKKPTEKAGYKDSRAWFSLPFVDLSQSALTMYAAVAYAFSEEAGRRFGVTCLYLLLTYSEAADLEVDHEEPGATLIEAQQENGRVPAPSPLSRRLLALQADGESRPAV